MDTMEERFSGFSDLITTIGEVRDVIDHPRPQIVAKQLDYISYICREFIARSPFMLIASSNAKGRCDISPKGDPAGFVQVLDDKHLAIPDRPGNRLARTFTNLLENPHLGLIFLIPGKNETLRISGEARVTRQKALLERMAVQGAVPKLAIVLYVEYADIHCPKCMIRSKLWQHDVWPDSSDLATVAEATLKHAKLDITLKELHALIEREGWRTLY